MPNARPSGRAPRLRAAPAEMRGQPKPASSSRSRMTIATGKASGSVNRLPGPGSVRHMSVTTAAQRRLLTGDDTR
jgi:hypothetical protein